MITLVDIILKGKIPSLDFNFLENLIHNNEVITFMYPDVSTIGLNETINVFYTNSYSDMPLTGHELDINGTLVSEIFVNVTCDNKNVELLFFLDLRGLNNLDDKKNLDSLSLWLQQFSKKYNFNSFICQMDNGNEFEYYFDNNGYGPLYSNL